MLPASLACAVVEKKGVATASSKQYLHNKHKQQNIVQLVWKSVRFLQNQKRICEDNYFREHYFVYYV